jgi:hypothetical protein
LQGLPAERAVVGRVAMAKEVGSETTARAGAARVAARTATEAAATVAVATAVGTRTARTATTAATTAREAAANGTPVMALGRVAVAAAEAVTVAAAKVAAEKAVTVREVQLGLVGESWILELSKNERDGRLPRLSVDAGGSHGVRRALASSRGGMATRQGRHRRGSPRNPSSRASEARKFGIERSFLGTESAWWQQAGLFDPCGLKRKEAPPPAAAAEVEKASPPATLVVLFAQRPRLHGLIPRGDACRAIGAEQRERIARMLCKGF